MNKERPSERVWEFLPEASSPFGLWQLEYPFKSDIEIITQIFKKLNNFIKPIFVNVNVLIGRNIKEAKLQENLYRNKSEGFSIKELESIYFECLNKVNNVSKNQKYTRCELSCQAYITYFENKGLRSGWFPSQNTLEAELRQYPDTWLDGLIEITMDQESMDIATLTDIWIPKDKNDQLAIINGNRLREMLIMIERITEGTIVQWSENKYVESTDKRFSYITRYGFIKPEDIQEHIK